MRSALLLLLAPLVLGSCGDSKGFGAPRTGAKLRVEIIDYETVAGDRLNPLPLTVNIANPFKIKVTAVNELGQIDTSYNGWVRISAKPGAIDAITGEAGLGRSLQLTAGASPETDVGLSNAYGTTFILADDLGYIPGDPVGTPPPICANGVDDDGDGVLDFPADDGCAFPNDNSEEGGTFAQGASPPLFFQLPRIADVRGVVCDAAGKCRGTGQTAYPKAQVILDTGFHDKGDGTRDYDFDMIVTRIASDGFYVSDVNDTRAGFNNIFSFNFNAPPRMRVCDRLKTFGGTANEFFGFTQIAYPTWTLEEWDPQKRPCLVPDPRIITAGESSTLPDADPDPASILLPLSGGLVRVISIPNKSEIKVTPKFGPGNIPSAGGSFAPSAEAGTNCDFDGNGTIDFGRDSDENKCFAACKADPECTEYSNFISRSSFRITITDLVTKAQGAVQADSTTSAEFKPLEMKGKPLKSFTGTLHFFSGGSQFTIEARCKDDIVVDPAGQPLPSDRACVFPRTAFEDDSQ